MIFHDIGCGLKRFPGATVCDGLDGLPVIIDGVVYAPGMLPLTIMGAVGNAEYRWSRLPYLNYLRRYLLQCFIPDGSAYEEEKSGRIFLTFAQESKAYNICYNLNEDLPVRKAEFLQDREAMAVVLEEFSRLDRESLIPQCCEELKTLGIPRLHLNYVNQFMNTKQGVHAMSACATLIVLAALVFLADILTNEF